MRKPRKTKTPPEQPSALEGEAVSGEVTYKFRLTQQELLSAVNMFLRARGDIPRTTVGHLRHRFGIIGNPQMVIMGDPPPNAGEIYLEWHFDPLENVRKHPTFYRETPQGRR